jgi:hypothetical protein
MRFVPVSSGARDLAWNRLAGLAGSEFVLAGRVAEEHLESLMTEGRVLLVITPDGPPGT